MPFATAAVKPGAGCPKLRKTVIISGKKFTCIKSGKKLVWNKGVKTRPHTPRVTLVPRPSATPNPQPTVNPQPGPGPSNQPNPQPSAPTAVSPATEVASTYSILAPGSGTAMTSSATPSGYLAAMGFASTSGSTLFDHPSGLASDGTNLVLVDRGNNRILVWRSAPTSVGVAPDFVLCQQNNTSIASGSALNQCNWPSDAIITPTGKLLVADSDNNRILVWNTIPNATGTGASYAINLGDDAWPWGIWSDGVKVAVTITVKGQLQIWNTFPTTGLEPPSITLQSNTTTCLGTPRGIVSNGTVLMVGDHNAKCANAMGLHVFRTFPTSAASVPDYMIVPQDANYAWPMGTFDKSTGKAYLLSRNLEEFGDFPASKPTAKRVASGTDFQGGDGGDVEIVNGYMYVTEYNGNRISVFKGIPDATAIPDFYLGITASTGAQPAENTLHTNFLITNPQVATLDGAMAINSDFDRKIYVWKKIPATNGAKPDLVWTTQNQNDPNPLLAMDFQPDSSDTGQLDGKSIYAAAGEKTFVVWDGIPVNKTDVPILNIKDSIGSVTFDNHLRVAVDDRYFYILDGGAKKIYVWLGLPTGKTDSPDFTVSAEVNRIRADGKYLIGTSLYTSPHISVWDVSTLKQDAQPTGRVSYQMNLPQDALTSGEALYVADTSFHRVLYWSSIVSAMSGAAPEAIVGAGSNTIDKRPGLSESELRWPASLWVESGYLWLGERKFGHRVLRYNLD